MSQSPWHRHVSPIFFLPRQRPRPSPDGSEDLEILVLRHQLRVLQRTSGPRKLRAIDAGPPRGGESGHPRDRWVAFLVTPAALRRMMESHGVTLATVWGPVLPTVHPARVLRRPAERPMLVEDLKHARRIEFEPGV